MKVEISRHAEQRMRERLGLPKKSIERIAQRAFDDGIRHGETKGNLRKWVTSVYFKNENANNIRIYGNDVFIFDGNILVTVYNIPRNFTNNLEKMVEGGRKHGCKEKRSSDLGENDHNR